jgi:hypothetical protein
MRRTMVYNCGKRLMFVFLLLACMQVAAFGQQSLLGLRLQQTAGGSVMTLQGPTGGFSANYTLRMPAGLGGTGSLLYMTGTASQLDWLAAGTNGYVLSLSGGVPVWVDPVTITGSGWGLSGNSIASAYNGTTGSFIGTTNTQPLIIATTNTTTPQLIGLYTNNTERARLTGAGEFLLGTTTPISLMTIAGEVYNYSLQMRATSGKPAYSEGRVFYDTSEKTLAYYNDHNGVTMNIGQESWIRVLNNSGSSIANGQAVYVSGADAGTGLVTIALARADALTTADAVGITTETIANGATGYVTSFGEIHDLNTSSFTAGATVYISATTAGALTTTRPSQPNFTNPIGFVGVSNATTGTILVLAGKTRQGASTTGAVPFGGSDGFLKENATNFVWDNTNTRLGIGTNTPAQKLDIRDGNLLLSRSAVASRQLQFQSANGAGLSTFEAGSQAATDFNYTLPITAPTLNQVLTATAVTGSAITLGWSNNAAGTGFVNYGAATAQATASPRTNFLFNVAYSSGAGNAAAAGAVITSSAGGAGTGNNATGLTVNSTVNNTATATGIVVSSTTSGSNSSTTGMTITSTATGTGIARGLTATVSGGTSNYSGIFSGGNVGIDTLTPNSKLAVSGETFSYSFQAKNNAGKPAYSEGRVFYDSSEKTLAYYNDHNGVTMNIGQESWIRVRNVTGSSIANGQAVYISGSDATTGLVTIALARADALATADAVGLTTETIANGATGYVTAFGEVHDLNTSSFTAGATVYISATTAGALTTTRPSQPNFTNPIGFVGVSNASTGTVVVLAGKTRAGASTAGAVLFGGSDGFTKENATNFLWDNTNSRLTLISPSTTDEHYSVRGEASGSSTNQIIGVWGEATNTGAGNTGTIGILASGNGNTTASQTNTALQINDGSFNIGRTTEAPGTGTAVEAATGGTAYTAQGPSGVIELAPFNADQVQAANTVLSWADHIVINNRYATANSIILLQVLNTADGTTNQVGGAFNNANVTFTTMVDDRQAGSFDISLGMFTFNALTIDGGAGATDRDLIRVGYTIINPSK